MARYGRFLVLGLSALIAINVVVLALLVPHWLRSGHLGVASVDLRQGKGGGVEAVAIRFTRPVIPGDRVGKSPGEAPLTFRPSISGGFRWADRRTLLFLPDPPLPAGHAYEIRVDDDLVAGDGRPLAGRRIFSLSTPPARLLDVHHAGIRPNGRPIIAFAFNAPVAPGDLRRHLRIAGLREQGEPGGPERRNVLLGFQVLGAKPRPTLEIVLSTAYRGSVRARIDPRLRPYGGASPIEGDLDREVQIDGDLILLAARGRSVSESEGRIELRFNRQIPIEGQERQITVAPPTPFRIDARYDGLVLIGAFRAGKRYEVRCGAGLRAGGNLALKEPATRHVLMPDLDPSVRILGRGLYLPDQRDLSIEVETVNTSRFVLRADAIHEGNIVWFFADGRYRAIPDHMGRRLLSRTFPIPSRPNHAVRTRVDLRELLGPDLRGLVALQAEIPNGWRTAIRLVQVTDLAATVKRAPGEVAVWVSRFAGPVPVEGADVRVLSRSNQLLGRSGTDARGIARVPMPDPRGIEGAPEGDRPGENHLPFLVTVREAGDLCALQIDKGRIPMADLPVSGRPYVREGYEAFIYGDRDLYRPGETAHLRVLVRDRDLLPPAPFPVRLVVRRPDGREWQTLEAPLSPFGGAEVALPIPAYMPTGRYTVRAEGPEKRRLGEKRILVEEFLPDRMKLRISLDRESARGGDTVTLALYGAQGFGKPAAGRKVAATVRIRERDFEADALPGGRFKPARRRGGRDEIDVRIPLGEARLDDRGRARIEARIPADLAPPSALEATFTATLWEAGGRATSARAALPVHIHPVYAGIERVSDPQGAGGPIAFRVAAIRPDGSPSPAAHVSVRFLRRFWRSVWRLNARHGWEILSEPREEEIETRTVDLQGGLGLALFRPPRDGAYVAQVRAPEGDHIAELTFSVETGRAWTPDAFPSPARARITLDRPRYRPGEIALARVRAPFGGLALIAIEGDRIHDIRVLPLPGGNGVLRIPVRRDFGPNAYVTASVVRAYPGATRTGPYPLIAEAPAPARPAASRRIEVIDTTPTLFPVLPCEGETGGEGEAGAIRAVPAAFRVEGARVVPAAVPAGPGEAEPALSEIPRDPAGPEAPIPLELLPLRAFAAAPLFVDPAERTLDVRLHVPEKARPGEEIEAQILVRDPDGLPAEAEVSLALVDEGILALTGMPTPDPMAHFFAKRRLEVEEADVYALVVPPVRGPQAAGGGEEGAASAAQRRRLTQPIQAQRVKPVALWLSPIRTDAEGLAFARFRVPEFDGRLRAMAVAAAREALGSTEAGMIVRRPIAVRPTFPRFLACGDRFAIPVVVLNDTGTSGELRVTVRAEGAARMAGEATVTAASESGSEALLRFEARAADGPGKAAFTVEAGLGMARVRRTIEVPVRPPLPAVRRTACGAIRGGERIAIDPGLQVLPGTGELVLRVAASPLAELGPALAGLRGYPYGCAEQTASRVLALAALADPALSDDEELPGILSQIATGVDRLFSMQTAAGGLSLWPGGRWDCPWASVYAAHVLCRVRDAGHPVDDDAFGDLVDFARAYVLEDETSPYGLTTRAYAGFASILAGKGEAAALERLAEEDLPDTARFLAALALHRAGEPGAARRLLGAGEPEIPPPGEDRPPEPETFGSGIRDDAILLLSLLEVEPASKAIPRLVERIRHAAGDRGRWRTTQENAFAVLALSRYARAQGLGRGAYRVRVLEGGAPAAEATEAKPFRRTFPVPLEAPLDLGCEGNAAYWSWTLEGVPAAGEAEEFDRGLRARRRILDFQGDAVDGALTQGESYIVEISLGSARSLRNVAVEDLLPAGLQIENPRLRTAAGDLPPELLKDRVHPDAIEMRDDRLLLFTGLSGSRRHPSYWRYVVRAVTEGTFALPAIRASCMYEPGVESVWGAGTIRVEG